MDAVLRARAELLTEADTAGARPTVVALAHRLGLTNATFWRHFPEVAREVAVAGRRQHHDDHDTAGPTRLHELEQTNAALRRANRDLTLNLKLAEASIQRLALDNHRLRQELEVATNVTRIDQPRRKS